MNKGLGERLKLSTLFEDRVFSKLEEIGFSVAKNGTEHTHPGFVNLIRQSNDTTSMAIRFEPDGVICKGVNSKTWYVEAKSGKKHTIEKNAYKQYMVKHGNGCIIVLVIEHENDMAWCFVENLKFLDSISYVSRFSNQHPVIDGWITPRASAAWMGQQRFGNTQASGTPYKVIDESCLVGIDRLLQEYIK